MWRKVPMVLLGVVLLGIWVTLAFVKHEALIFVCIVMVVGLIARQFNRYWSARKGPKVSLLRQAIMEQLPQDIWSKPKILIGTYGSDALAPAAFVECKRTGSALIVCFIRQINLSYKYEYNGRLTIDTDLAALRTFSRFLDMGHEVGVEVVPFYDTGPDAVELIAEAAAVYGVQKILIGSSRQGALYHLVKGHFQQRMEEILPPEIPVEVVPADRAESARTELEALQAEEATRAATAAKDAHASPSTNGRGDDGTAAAAPDRRGATVPTPTGTPGAK
jgi:hypothetical protein